MLTQELIAQIIQRELDLPDESIWIENQRRKIPPTISLYVTVGLMNMNFFGNNNRFDPATMQEIQQKYTQEVVSINMTSISPDMSAFERSAELVGALNSIYAQQVQEEYGFKIGVIPTTVNVVPQLEGASQICRVALTVRVLRAYEKRKSVGYYDTFGYELLTERGKA